ncbi:MAG: hypothetical protein Hyperionvirus15_18 [Hyperionvirus sp.]|uniref:Uncharacterized protein n=1 Tax=Hyperionvirus sp. TaxID=2487770 RepID=A0A3G5A9P0_9VIRU|nr:MAG: hypothetical protein Hyperionvirus15_18 [Hyperionvirus sp.]
MQRGSFKSWRVRGRFVRVMLISRNRNTVPIVTNALERKSSFLNAYRRHGMNVMASSIVA